MEEDGWQPSLRAHMPASISCPVLRNAPANQADDELQHFPGRASHVCSFPAPGRDLQFPGTAPPPAPNRLGGGGGFWRAEKASSLTPGSRLPEELAPQLASRAGCSTLLQTSQRSQQRRKVPSVHLPCPDMRLEGLFRAGSPGETGCISHPGFLAVEPEPRSSEAGSFWARTNTKSHFGGTRLPVSGHHLNVQWLLPLCYLLPLLPSQLPRGPRC